MKASNNGVDNGDKIKDVGENLSKEENLLNVNHSERFVLPLKLV